MSIYLELSGILRIYLCLGLNKFCPITLAYKANVETAEPNEYSMDPETRLPSSTTY